MQRHTSLFQGVLTHSERRTIAAFVQAPPDYFDAELKQMKMNETFEEHVVEFSKGGASKPEGLRRSSQTDEIMLDRTTQMSSATMIKAC